MNIGIRISVIKKDTTSKNKVYISSPSVRFPIYYIILLFKYGMYIVFCTIIILMSSVSLYNCITMKKEIHMKRTEKIRMHPALKVLLAFLIISILVFAGIIAYVYINLKGAADKMYDDDFADSSSEMRDTEVSVKDGDPISVVLFGTDSDEERESQSM